MSRNEFASWVFAHVTFRSNLKWALIWIEPDQKPIFWGLAKPPNRRGFPSYEIARIMRKRPITVFTVFPQEQNCTIANRKYSRIIDEVKLLKERKPQTSHLRMHFCNLFSPATKIPWSTCTSRVNCPRVSSPSRPAKRLATREPTATD